MAGQIYGFEHGGSRRYAELASKLMATESADAPLPPGIILELDRPEWSYHKRERRWVAGILQAAIAGQFSEVGIIVPINSRVITVVQQVFVVSQGNGIGVRARIVPGSLGLTSFNLDPLDSRINKGTPVGGFQSNIFAGSNAVAQLVVTNDAGLQVSLSGTNGVYTELPWLRNTVLVGDQTGAQLLVEGQTVNVAISAIFAGYERPATVDELAQ